MIASKLFGEEESGVDSSLAKLSRISNHESALIAHLQLVRQYYDEPKFWHYSATLNSKYSKHDGRSFHSRASGVSLFSEEVALLKCLGESVERYCNYIYYKDSTSFIGSFEQIKDKAVDPNSFAGVLKEQLRKESFRQFRISKTSHFRWTKCLSLTTGRSILIPSQLIYLSYQRLGNEPIIYPGISTGAAGGSCLSAALVRGIYEVIERDAFMIFYLNKLPAPKIQLKLIKNSKVKKVLRIADRYKLKVISLDITTDLDIPVIATVVLNDTGVGKAVSVGLKSDICPLKALLGSVREAFHTRTWFRQEYERNPKRIRTSDLLKHPDFKSRGLLWYPVEAIKNLDFWTKSPEMKSISDSQNTLPSGLQLKILLSVFKKFGYDIFFKDLMIQPLKNLDYYVVKIIIPQMQPLYLNEKFPLLGGKRLYDVPVKLGYVRKTFDELNKYPHPFL